MGAEAGALIDPIDDADGYVAALRATWTTTSCAGRSGGAAARSARSSASACARWPSATSGCTTTCSAASAAQADRECGRLTVRAPTTLRSAQRLRCASPRARRTGAPLVSVIVPASTTAATCPACLDVDPRAGLSGQDRDDRRRRRIDRRRDARACSPSSRATTRCVRASGSDAERRARAAPATPASSALAGRYVLPVDADNVLLPHAVERLVDAAPVSAGERVGFVYQNLQYFGNRTDFFQAPAYNLAVLLRGQLLRHVRADRSRGLRRRLPLRRGHRAGSRGLGLRTPARGTRRDRRARAGEPRCSTASGASRARTRSSTRRLAVPRAARSPRAIGASITPERRDRDQGALGPGLSLVAARRRSAKSDRLADRRAAAPVRPCATSSTSRRGSGATWPERDDGPAVRRYPAALAATAPTRWHWDSRSPVAAG